MTTSSENKVQEWNNEEQPLNRRRLLTGTVGGLVLTAGGLLLPDWLLEVEAREGALGGSKGGRRGKDHKGRNKKRKHGDKKEKKKDDAPRGAGLFRATSLTVVNKGVNPLDCSFFYRIKTGLDDYAGPTANGTRTIQPNESYRYNPDRYRVGVLIKQVLGPADIYADVRNVSFFFPRGGVTQGASLDPAASKFGDAFIAEQNFSEGEAQQNQNVVLQRVKDDSKGGSRIEWELIVR
jgi:hypothetical protein